MIPPRDARFRKPTTILILSVIVCFTLFYSVHAIAPETLSFTPLTFKPPQPEKLNLSNGMDVYFLEDHELPLVTVDVLIRSGTLHEPQDRVGLYQIMADLMLTGGTETLSPDSVDEVLESMAAEIDISLGLEYGIATLDVLSEDIADGLEIFTDMLSNPGFDVDRMELRKKQELESIRRRNDNPFNIASRFFPAYLYGREHPLGSYVETDGIRAINREDLRRAHANLFHAQNLSIAVTGDFEKARMVRLLEKHFQGWETGMAPRSDIPEPRLHRDGPLVLYVEKDLNQSTILLGQTSLTRSPDNEDIYALRVMNEILGESSFTSRLFREVRDKRGLAYSVGSYFNTSSYTFPGNWLAFAQTRAEKTVETTAIMIDVIDGMKREPVPDHELQLTKDSLTNSFVFGFTDSASITRQRLILDFRGYHKDYLQNYTARINEVTAGDVQRVANTYLDLNHLIIVVVGNEELFEQPLKTLGNVVVIDADN
jgi:predicted Zn-dependent peptidase